MLYFREGWNYLLELYFWILIGAILLVSITILLARPPPKTNTKQYDNLEGFVGETPGNNSVNNNSNKSNIEENAEEPEEELPPEVIEKIERRRWALGFVMFGSAFAMVGSIILFLLDYEFTTFLGSCMIYVGIIALCKGASFELQKDNKYTKLSSTGFYLFIFFINFILLTDLLDVIGNYAWAVMGFNRKIGDLILIYLLPYLIWKLVPTFGVSEDLDNNSKEFDYGWLAINLQTAVFFSIFNYIILVVTSLEYIFWPVLNQYAGPGFQMSLYLIIISIGLNSWKSTFVELNEPLTEVLKKRNEEEGKAIRDFTEENEDEYFKDEYYDAEKGGNE